jgi:hypothetical protein
VYIADGDADAIATNLFPDHVLNCLVRINSRAGTEQRADIGSQNVLSITCFKQLKFWPDFALDCLAGIVSGLILKDYRSCDNTACNI